MTGQSQRASPYQGLVPYREEDASFFFGREREIRLISASLFAAPLTLLFGPSGVGKSSLLDAGVVPRMRQRNDVLVVYFDMREGDLAARLKARVAEVAERVTGKRVSGADTLGLADFLASTAGQLDRQLMIILDQFEDYFRGTQQQDAENTFEGEFARAVNRDELSVRFLISLREDSLAELSHFEGRIPRLFDNYLRIERLEQNAARDAIRKPLEQYNLLYPSDVPFQVETDLVEAVLDQVKAGQVGLEEGAHELGRGDANLTSAETQIETPYLQLVMQRLWEREMEKGSHTLRSSTLSELGGAEHIVQTHLDDVLSSLSPEEQYIASQVFPYLVTRSGASITHNLTDLAAPEYAGVEREELAPLLEKLAAPSMRILRSFDPAPGQDTRRYGIFHDALSRPILAWRNRYIRRPWGYVRNLATGKVLPLHIDTVSIGRSVDYWPNTINLQHQQISRIHLLLTRSLLVDMRSVNGTTLNSEQVPYLPPRQLSDGDIIVLAGVATLQFGTLKNLVDMSIDDFPPPLGWGVLIDGRARTFSYLDADECYLSLDERGHITVSDHVMGSAFLRVWRDENQIDEDGKVIVNLQYLDYDTELHATQTLRGERHEYTFKLEYREGTTEIQAILEIRNLLDEQSEYPFQPEAVPHSGALAYNYRTIPFQIVPIVEDLELATGDEEDS